MLGPDEFVYRQQANTLREHGVVRGFRLLADRFMSDRGADALPSPLRWGWILIRSAAGWRVSPAAGLALLPFAGPSPLLVGLSRRELQDSVVAATTLGAVALGLHGSAWVFAVAFVLLSLKDVAALLAFPALAAAAWFGGIAPTTIALGMMAVSAAWLLSTRLLLGWRTSEMLVRAARGHETPYSRAYQRGAPHRLLVDLLLVSPIPLAIALHVPFGRLHVIALLLVAAHALSPVRNIRTVLAADVLVRWIAIGWIVQHPIWIAPSLAADLWISWQTRNVYDPTTQALAFALGLSRQTEAK